MTVTSMMHTGGSYDLTVLAQMLQSFIRDGYVSDIDSELAVTATDPASLSVILGSGRARIQGYWYDNSAAQTITISAADATNPRIDRVVLRLVPGTTPRGITAEVLEGAPAASPAAPALTQNAATWEISLAQIAVGVGATSIATANITDERNSTSICGVAAIGNFFYTSLIPTAAIPLGGNKVTNLATPTATTDLANKAYFDTTIGSTLGAARCLISWVYGAVPTGWLECNGQAVSRTTYPILFLAWGTTFGPGDGSTTFNLPDLRGRMVYGGSASIGTKSGAKTVTLTTSTMPAHTHAGARPGSSIAVFNNYSAGSYYGGAITLDPTENTGGGGAHTNLSQYMALRSIVRAE
jgi:microcystin-dependent protein